MSSFINQNLKMQHNKRIEKEINAEVDFDREDPQEQINSAETANVNGRLLLSARLNNANDSNEDTNEFIDDAELTDGHFPQVQVNNNRRINHGLYLSISSDPVLEEANRSQTRSVNRSLNAALLESSGNLIQRQSIIPRTCSQCGNLFSSGTALRNHRMSFHSNALEIKSAFNRGVVLATLLRDPDSGMFQCACGSYFRSKSNSYYHRKCYEANLNLSPPSDNVDTTESADAGISK